MKKIISSLSHSFKTIIPYKFFKAYSKRTMQPSPYKGQIVPVNTSFANQDLSHQDFTGTDFSNCDMKDAILTGCIFDKANLSQVQNLTEKQFAGCSLIDAILPKDFKFSYLDNFDKMMTQARDIFALSLSTSLFGIIAVMSTADEDFLVGGKSLTMPLIGVAVDMTSLYIFLPITIMAVGLYLNIYLNKIQSIVKKFPYYLPDGREIELLLYPWLWNYITKPLYHKKRKLRLSYAMFTWLGAFISYAMVHVTAGLSIMIITFTYFKVQDPIMTTFHLAILGVVTFFAFLHFRIKYRERKFVLSFLMPIIAFSFTVMMAICGSFVYTEKPIFVNLYYDPNGWDEERDLRKKSLFYKIGIAHDSFFNSYITATYKKISQNSSGCATPKRNKLGEIIQDNNDDKSCQNVAGVDLRNRNLMNLNAPNSFFVNALLQDTNLKHANLKNADLRWAKLDDGKLQQANLEYANLQDADLRDAKLQKADLSFVNLQDADLSGADLQNAGLSGADLQKVDLRGANLQNVYLEGENLQKADLSYANLQDAELSGANLQDADLMGTNLQNATLRDAKLQKADLRDAKLQKADLIMAKLQKADLRDAKLQKANLMGVNLQNATLSRADLQKADLIGANLQKADLIGANLQDAELRGANLQDADLSGADLQNADLSRADLQNVALSGADLTSVIIDEDTNFTNAVYNSRNYANYFTRATLFPLNFNPATKGIIDICTPEGKEAFKQAIQKGQYKSIKWEEVKDAFEIIIECVPPES